MSKTATEPGLNDLLDTCPRVRALIERTSTIYLGPCVVQAPGAWTRMGPTWLVAGIGWVIVGPGVASWGTTRGLAELATDASAKPKLHALGVAVVERPNVVFAMTALAISSVPIVERLAAGVEA